MLFKLHKYAGLIAGLLMALTGVTGSLLVFHHTLDEWLTPHLRSEPAPHTAPLNAVLAAADAAVPGKAPRRLEPSPGPGRPHTVRFDGPEGAPGPLQVSVSPINAEVLAVRQWGAYPTSWVYRLHYTLLAGTTGKYVVGVGGLLLMFFCFSGLYLWWPRKGQWRRALTVRADKGPFRFNFDLHKAAGFYLMPVLLVTAFTGVSLVFHGPVQSLVGTALPMDTMPAPTLKARPSGGDVLNVDQAVAAAQPAFPDGRLNRIDLPGDDRSPYRLSFTQPDEAWSNHGASRVWVDPRDGAIVATWNPLTVAAGSRFMGWQFPLHNGDALGLAGRWLIFLGGWFPALLFGTGLYLWWRKRRPRRRSRRPTPATRRRPRQSS